MEIGERQHCHCRSLVGHYICVHPPHHDGARLERVNQADADCVTFRSDPGCHDLAACERECDLQPGRPAGQILVALRRFDVLGVVLDSADQLAVRLAESLGDPRDRPELMRVASVDQEWDRRRPPVGCVQHAADHIEVQPEHVVVVRLGLLDRLNRPGRDLRRRSP